VPVSPTATSSGAALSHAPSPAVRGAAELGPAAELFKALAHPVRLCVVRALTQGPPCVHELVERAQVSQPLLSQHLRVLRTGGLICGARRGKEVAYRLTDSHLSQLAEHAFRQAAGQARALPALEGPAGAFDHVVEDRR